MGDLVQFVPKANPDRDRAAEALLADQVHDAIKLKYPKTPADTAPSEWNCDSGDCV